MAPGPERCEPLGSSPHTHAKAGRASESPGATRAQQETLSKPLFPLGSTAGAPSEPCARERMEPHTHFPFQAGTPGPVTAPEPSPATTWGFLEHRTRIRDIPKKTRLAPLLRLVTWYPAQPAPESFHSLLLYPSHPCSCVLPVPSPASFQSQLLHPSIPSSSILPLPAPPPFPGHRRQIPARCPHPGPALLPPLQDHPCSPPGGASEPQLPQQPRIRPKAWL